MIALAQILVSTSLLALVPAAPGAGDGFDPRATTAATTLSDNASTDGDDLAAPAAAALFAPFAERASLRPLPELPELSKKQQWLTDKSRRRDVRLTDHEFKRDRQGRRCARRPSVAVRGSDAGTENPSFDGFTGARVEPLTTLFNLRTREALPLLPGLAVSDHFHHFLRDYTTNQATRMDTRLIGVLERVALRFSPERIEVVSGYRSPKYNLSLRKKGRQVARSSQHSEGHAVDFRVRGVPTRRLLNFVKSLQVGGVGYYPHSEFVHSDTGRIRFWRGT